MFLYEHHRHTDPQLVMQESDVPLRRSGHHQHTDPQMVTQESDVPLRTSPAHRPSIGDTRVRCSPPNITGSPAFQQTHKHLLRQGQPTRDLLSSINWKLYISKLFQRTDEYNLRESAFILLLPMCWYLSINSYWNELIVWDFLHDEKLRE